MVLVFEDMSVLVITRCTTGILFGKTIQFVMSTRRLIDGENDPKMNANQPSLKGNRIPRPEEKKEMKTFRRI